MCGTLLAAVSATLCETLLQTSQPNVCGLFYYKLVNVICVILLAAAVNLMYTTKTSQPNVCDTISSSLCYYKLVNLMCVTLIAVVPATLLVCDSSLCYLKLVNLMCGTLLAAVSATTN